MPIDIAPPGPQLPSLTGPHAKAHKAAQEFEAVALAEMLRPMFESLDTDGLGGGGSGERMFRPMLVDQYAQRLAERGGIGIADAVLKELLRMQAETST